MTHGRRCPPPTLSLTQAGPSAGPLQCSSSISHLPQAQGQQQQQRQQQIAAENCSRWVQERVEGAVL
jgi:hypothetical protein